MKLIKAETDFPSPYELEINSEEELEIIEEALKSYHNQLFDNKQYKESLKVHDICHDLEIPGY
jgi:hypothetical protein